MASADQITYQLLTTPDDLSFPDFFRIYKNSIHPREQKCEDLISKMVGRPDYRICLQTKNGMAVGFSIVFAPESEKFCLLEYMAVDASQRNSGLGGQLFLHTLEQSLSKQGEQLTMVLEVDSDREASADRELRKRRLQFYKRLGCLQVEGLPYILPLGGKDAVPEMFLLLHVPAKLQEIHKPQLKHWLSVIYRMVYNCSSDDPRIAHMIENVTDPVKFV